MLTFIDTIGFWLSMAVGVVVYAWPQFRMPRTQRLNEAGLLELSPAFKGVARAYLMHSMLTFLLTMVFLVVVLYLPIHQTPNGGQAARLAWPAVLLSFIGLMQGLFAVLRGVYPASRYNGRYTFFGYTKDGEMKTLGRRQMLSALLVAIIALLAGLLRYLA
ncbi:MAG: hypothetical protein JW726_17295 [Anaerolineales bacterium]|nr:hypothetical protein [Anaerolineales bacterium]